MDLLKNNDCSYIIRHKTKEQINIRGVTNDKKEKVHICIIIDERVCNCFNI